MKRLTAVMLVLMLLLGTAALAEPDSVRFRFEVDDPKLYQFQSYDEAAIDATGLRLSFSALSDGKDTLGLIAGGFAGEDLDMTVIRTRVQLDPDSLLLTADGLSSVYAMYGYPGSGQTIAEAAQKLSDIAEAVHTGGLSAGKRGELLREAALNGFVKPFSTGETGTDGGVMHTFSFEGSLSDLLKGIDSEALSAMTAGIDADLLERVRLAVNGTCVLGADGSSLTLDADGTFSRGSEIPFHMTAILNGADISVDASLAGNGKEAVLQLSSHVDPENYRMNESFLVEVPGSDGEPARMALTCTRDDSSEGYLYLDLDASYQDAVLGLTLDGIRTAEDGGYGFAGDLLADLKAEGLSASAGGRFRMNIAGADSADWMMDAGKAIDIANMSSGQTTMLTFGLTGVAANAIAVIRNHVPSLAPYADRFVSVLMGR